MGVPAAKVEPDPLVSARVKVRPKAQLTLLSSRICWPRTGHSGRACESKA
jgi:hypothetical protein